MSSESNTASESTTASAFARFPPRLQEAIVSRLGWASLRPVQELSSAALLDGLNAVILAPTAGGKTEAAVFPLLAGLMEREPEGVGVIYLAPIKALLNNQSERLATYTEMVGLRRFLWHGDVGASEKRRFVREPAELLMTTPESLEVMLLSGRVPHTLLFKDLRAVIVDEVHALAGSDRGAHLMSVLERIADTTPNDVQRVGLSATVGNPDVILEWLQGTSRRAGRVVDPPKTPSEKDLRILLPESIAQMASVASRLAEGKKSLFFCQSRSLTEAVAERFRGRGTDVFVHHSSVSREEREVAEERFHHGRNACIVCTSTLELGIDVGDLDLVFQANAPSTVSSFMQRLGRTGRRPMAPSGVVGGENTARANTTFLCEDVEVALQAVAIVELARRGWVERVPVRRRCWPVLVHQLLALSIESGGVSAETAWQRLSRVPDFSAIEREEFDVLVEHLVAEDFLYRTEGLLVIGDETERVFGRRNFMELYAVFSSPQLYRVETSAGYLVGYLEQGFVDKLVEDMSSFLLSGKAWTVASIHHGDRKIRVVPAPRGRKPSWGGFMPQLLGFELCQQMAEVLTSDDVVPFMEPRARDALARLRDDLGPLLRASGLAFRVEPAHVLWWTFAGGAVNHALRLGLMLQDSRLKIVADNFRLKIVSAEGAVGDLHEPLGRMASRSFWDDEENQRRLLAALPEYRLSKFQRALPSRFSIEMVRDHLLDVQGAIGFLRSRIGASHP